MNEWVDEAVAAAGGVHDKKKTLRRWKPWTQISEEEVQLQVHATKITRRSIIKDCQTKGLPKMHGIENQLQLNLLFPFQISKTALPHDFTCHSQIALDFDRLNIQ